MDFDRIDINQCPKGEGNKGPNLFADTSRCKKETTEVSERCTLLPLKLFFTILTHCFLLCMVALIFCIYFAISVNQSMVGALGVVAISAVADHNIGFQL